MKADLLPFSLGAWVVIGAYVGTLLVIGWLGYRARREHSLRDFYLAGHGLGFIVLLLTLYATQYSGNTLFGFTGKTYRIGYAWVMSLHFMTAIVVFYLLFAPQLHAQARRHGFITPVDYLDKRYGCRLINLIATVVMIVALSNYTLAQLMAMGRALEGLSGTDPARAYLYGVVSLALIMVIYETLGGMRAVAWTDVIQGTVLVTGFGIILVLVFKKFGSVGDATRQILASTTDRGKALPPDGWWCREWLSYILMVGLGGALYPQAIQRIYAARSAKVLRRSLMVMAFLPLTTALIALIVGVMALAHFPGFEKAATDRVLMVICRQVQAESAFGYWLVVILFAAVLAAIMSTADSALLSISSMVTKDLYARFLKPKADERELTRLGKLSSWVVVAVLVWFAIALRENTTLVKLLDRKFDILVQLVPAFMIGINWPGLRRWPTLAGMIVGLAVALGLVAAFDGKKIAGFHPGLFGLAANCLVAVGGSLLTSGSPAVREREGV